MNPLFDLDDSVLDTIAFEDAKATTVALDGVGMLRLPADTCDIRVRMARFLEWIGLPTNSPNVKESDRLLVKDVALTAKVPIRFFNGSFEIEAWRIPTYLTKAQQDETAIRFGVHLYAGVVDALVCALATRNIEKQVHDRPSGKMRRDGVEKHTRVTTLRVPKVRYLHDDPDRPSTGRNVRAHFRRGHIRDQRHGPGWRDMKRVWIEPVFVKADSDFLPQKEYRITA